MGLSIMSEQFCDQQRGLELKALTDLRPNATYRVPLERAVL
jgi:hypothetical protein